MVRSVPSSTADRVGCGPALGSDTSHPPRSPRRPGEDAGTVHQVFQLFGKTRVVTQLETLHPMRFQSVCPPDPTHRGSAHTGYGRHGTGAPVGFRHRLLLGREAYDLINRRQEDARGPPGARVILQTLDLGCREALSPTAYG